MKAKKGQYTLTVEKILLSQKIILEEITRLKMELIKTKKKTKKGK